MSRVLNYVSSFALFLAGVAAVAPGTDEAAWIQPRPMS